MIADRPPSIDVLGCRVDAVGVDDAVARIVAAAQASRPVCVVTLGVEMVMEARRNPRFREAIRRFDLALCDTIGILLASRLRGGPLRERVTGVDLIGPLARRSAERGDVRLYLMGGAPGVAERAAAALTARFPGAHIAGARDGYFAPEQSGAVAATIAASGANVLLAGLGSPKQELWLETYLRATGAAVGIGVGGAFDVIAGTKKRAPRFMQRLGLEWFFRLVQEPSRWRRQLALPQFAVAATVEALSRTRKGTIER
jgi:N-acetylglucosaminyldiphosphoundecaprenol N-acetyl-beta-D-mannosaminyltransferase